MKKRELRKTTILMVIILMTTLLIGGCNRKADGGPQVKGNPENPRVQIEMEDGGIMVIELYPQFAPETVENFISLSKSGFYNGLTFHRIVEGFMIQGGDPNGDGTGGSEKSIRGEFAENGFAQNTLKHRKGVISMARSSDPDSASSQFFIMDGDGSFLDGEYAAFGALIEGEEVLDRVADTPVIRNPFSGEMSQPMEDIIIKSITVVEPGTK